MTIERLKELAHNLPHSQGRMPYTYHHDAIRIFVQEKTGELPSRSDISELTSNEEELYTIALYQVMKDLTPLSWLEIEREYMQDLKEVYQKALILIPKIFQRHYELKYTRK